VAKNGFGYPPVRVGTWSPAQMTFPQHTSLEWDATGAFASGAGPYQVVFQYTSGGVRFEVHKAELLEDGKVVASDPHFGRTGVENVDNLYHLDLAAWRKEARYVLRVEAGSDIGTDTNGTVDVAFLGQGSRIFGAFRRNAALGVGETFAQSSVMGVVPVGQRRRGFLHYLERERAHPYRSFLHYNTWYDLGYFDQYTESGALGVIQSFGAELHTKRGVPIRSFLMDDGWDDPATLWGFHSGFGNGFVPLKDVAAPFGGAPGVWLSPWGGYGTPQQQRLAYGSQQGYETNASGFVLSAPKYYARFLQICLDMIRTQGSTSSSSTAPGAPPSAIRAASSAATSRPRSRSSRRCARPSPTSSST
jgi:hypothetical protein